MEVDQEGARRKRDGQNETHSEKIPDEGGQKSGPTAGTTEYAANSEPGTGGSGYVEGEDLPTEGRDDAPQG
jgi:hypothetical protein